jgi:hypothetical protein
MRNVAYIFSYINSHLKCIICIPMTVFSTYCIFEVLNLEIRNINK